MLSKETPQCIAKSLKPGLSGYKKCSIIIVIMTTALPNQVLPEASSTESSLAAIFLEPLMIVGSVLFWALVLPLAAVLRLSVGTYDAVASVLAQTKQLEGLGNRQANPLVLRRGAAQSGKPAMSSPVARQSV